MSAWCGFQLLFLFLNSVRNIPGGLFLLLMTAALPSCFADKSTSGAALYQDHCAGCHGEQGQGLGRLIPPLAGADYLEKHRYELPCLLRHGMNYPIVVNGVAYQQVMPGDSLTPAKITNLLNYVENSWGNQHTRRTITETGELLRACPKVQ